MSILERSINTAKIARAMYVFTRKIHCTPLRLHYYLYFM